MIVKELVLSTSASESEKAHVKVQDGAKKRAAIESSCVATSAECEVCAAIALAD